MARGTWLLKGYRNANANELITFERNVFNHHGITMIRNITMHTMNVKNHQI